MINNLIAYKGASYNRDDIETVCVPDWVIIGSSNGFWPDQNQATTETNDDLL